MLYVSNDSATSEGLQKHILDLGYFKLEGRDKQRLVEERQHKWNLNAVQLIEFFSSLGFLLEVAAAESFNHWSMMLIDQPEQALAIQPALLHVATTASAAAV
jgi:hypothetical protein